MSDKLKVICFLLFVFTLLNISYSQTISPIYFQLINDHQPATAEFLKRIRNLPMFNFYLTTNIGVYGRPLENQVFQQEQIEEKQIVQLKELFKKNPKTRDVAYKLYLLNKGLGNNKEAEKYLKMAKEIDPEINQ